MEIKIRKIDAAAIRKIDEMASRSGLSRNAHLSRLIEKHAFEATLSETENKYEQLAHLLATVIRENTAMMQRIYGILEEHHENN